ncbi:hypothetical protein LMG27174_03068 [Paraburkholderia rhynchosiae]|uniref:Uncharacterized protein n=1 Tax=Paraburkholderia rhynchosiae TaxID=487049 RepID=A0A2N7WLA5_9BURK|nr:hypothetical protein C0Z16_14805 [Paraburkholderia rhynchosiae]CAB3689071.1 hypothetical protein LMG27174_03068 [Paraburkholderia rhynchosiae]
MTVPSNLNSTRVSSAAPTKAAEKPAASTSSTYPGSTVQAKGSTTQAQPLPSMPAGLVGHHVNTTA